MDEFQRPVLLSDEFERLPGLRVPRVFVSARTGEGLDSLRALIATQAAQLAPTAAAGVTELPDGSPLPSGIRPSFASKVPPLA